MIIVSACLAGENTRYNGGNKLVEEIKRMVAEGKAVAVCPETAGGLAIPRPPAEIINGDGSDVLNGKARVKNSQGKDVTQQFLTGAEFIAQAAAKFGAKAAILKTRSGSCGCGKIYDGTFTGTLRSGDGVAAAMLKQHGIKIYNEENFRECL